MLLRPHERLPLITPALELTLAIVQIVLVPGLAVFAEVSLFTAYIGPKGIVQNNSFLIVTILALFALHLALIRAPAIKAFVENAIGKLKRFAVLSCPWVSASRTPSGWKSACWFIPEEFKQPLFRYDSQQRVVDEIVKRLASEQLDDVRFVYIEGESGKGKTRTIFLLIHSLLKHRKLFDLANRAFLYDMSLGHSTQSALATRLDSIEHENALIFVDNFHRVEPKILKSITQKLLDTPGPNAERLVVILGQPGHAWRIRPTAEVRLVSTARSGSVYFVLGGLPGNFIAEQLIGQSGSEIWTNTFGHYESQKATVAQLQFAQAITRSKRKELVSVKELVDLIEGTSHQTSSAGIDLVRLVAFVTALSLYRGYFTNGDFLRVCWKASSNQPWAAQLVDYIKMWWLLRRLSRLGFVARVTAPNRQFVFHEAMAEHCKDRLETNETFWACFSVGVKSRLAGNEEQEPMIRWLLSSELHDTRTMEDIFDQALLSGTLSPMVRCLDRNWSHVQDSPVIRYQYAMLLDQVGRFAESRLVFAGFPRQQIKASALAGRVRLARVEVEHTSDSYAALSEIEQQGDTANTIAAQYWRIHLNAHRGIFRPDELTSIVRRMGQLFHKEDFERSHFLVHQAARVFFDAHRHVYLSGERVEERLDRLRRLPIEITLRQHLPQFLAFAILYREAHLLAHEFLPNLVFFGTSPDFRSLSGKTQTEASITPRAIVSIAREAYGRAQDEFALYGDREYLYLQADILNLEMLSQALSEDWNPETVRLKLIDYEAFIQKTVFADLLSYPAFYFFRWHMLTFFRWLERGDLRHAQDEAEANFQSASKYLAKAVRFDQECGNAYGLWRNNFFTVLIKGLRHANAKAMVASLREFKVEAEKLGYSRDARIVQFLIDHPKITPLDIKQVILFFPFVHQ